MKRTFLCCLIACATFTTHAQISSSPAWYLDSQFVNQSKVYLNPDNIAHIDVVKDADFVTQTNGRIFITLKQPYNSFVTLPQLTTKYATASKVICFINGKLIKDTAGVRIDPSFLAEVNFTSMSDIPYLNGNAKNIGILIIHTKGPSAGPDADKEKMLRIRGAISKN